MKKIKTNRNLLRFGALLVLVAMWVITPFAIGDRTASAEEMISDVIRIGATLTGAPINGVTPTGFGEYRVDDQNRRRLDIDGFSVNLPAGTSLAVSVNNAVIGNASVSSCGTFLFRLRTDDGQQVPVITAGMPVQISNGGNVVLTGTFGSAGPSPSPSGSPSSSPSPSPSASPCASPSPTGSPTGSPSPSPTGSPNGTPSPSPSGSPGPSPSPTGSPNGEFELFAGLTGPTINGILPNGFAQFEVHSSRLELEIRVRQVNLPAGSQLPVIVDNVNVGSLFLESGGEGRLRLRTDNGQPVPPVVVGSSIAIRSGGNNILTGTFGGFTGPSPSPSPSASPSPGGTPNPSPSPSPSASPSLGRSFESHLNGAGMTPSVQTNATGEIKVTLNATETQATIFGEFHNLGTNQTGARIEALVGDGVLVRELGVVGGLNGNFPSVTIDVTAAQVSQLRSGLWSAVITSVNNPAGEIRGRFIQRSNLADFDGDGSSDFAVFRPSEGTWYSMNSNGFTASSLGGPTDKVVSADYDGDGKTDTAVFKNVNGAGIWQIKRSSDSGITATQFGYSTDIPVRGDFDGDGINDIAVYRPSNGVWYIRNSSRNDYTIVRYGLAEDKPIALDMDGDGRDDIAVFRPSTGVWYWLLSANARTGAVRFGLAEDVPVRGDFDGDGKTDITVYRPSTGIWYTQFSSTGGYRSVRWGLSGDLPVAGKYDGDNKADIALFRPSDGKWYILRSTDGAFQQMHFGLTGDIPVSAR